MPLLGRKLYEPIVSEEGITSEKSFIISHTQEVFHSEKEYKERLKLYEKKIWSCQCTGHVGLTHKEATDSELACRKKLATFGEVWEAPILQLVQHSYASLDTIVLQAHQLLLTQLVPGEKVIFTVKIPDKTFDATVVKYYERTSGESSNDDSNETESETPSTGTSPSSDKENKKRQALITDVFKSEARRSPRCSNFSLKADFLSKSKRLQIIPANYDILLSTQNTIVSKVPSEHLNRAEKPPNKESIRLFIRSNAVRLWGGKDKLPWIVSEDMVFRHSLKPQISPEEERRMLKLSTVNLLEKLVDIERLQPFASERLHNGSPLTNGVSSANDDDDEEVCLAEVKKKQKLNSSEKKWKKSRLEKKTDKTQSHKRKLSSTAKVKAKKSKSSKTNENKKPTGMDLFLKKMGKASNYKKNLSSNETVVVIDDDDEDDAPLSSRFTLKAQSKSSKKTTHSASRKNSTPKKKKQATLLELTKKGSGIKIMAAPSTTKSLNRSPRKPRQPRIALQLMSLKKEKTFRARKYNKTVIAACKILTDKQRENLPVEIKEDVVTKWDFLEKKRKFQAMTPEEKQAFILARKKERRDNARAERAAFPKKDEKFEDLHLVVSAQKQLPDLELRGLPENIPNTSFGDIAMLCEFLYSYHSLLCPKDPSFHKQFNIHTLSEAVTAGKLGFRVTRKVLVLLLQTLLADDVARDYCAIDFPLNQILVTPEVSCELTRVCLRQHDDELDDESESGSNSDAVDTGLSDSTSRRLFEMELYEMHPAEQVEVMSTLAYRVMNTYAAQSHMDDTMLKATTIWKKVIKQGVERKKEEKELQQEMKEKNADASPLIVEQGKGESLNNSEQKDSDLNKSPSKMDLDLVSRVKQRKILSARHKKEEAERKEKLRKEQEEMMVKQKSIQEREKTKRQLAETRMLAVHVRRRVPLGTDRNHSRYWLFCDGVPGLYVEKGWIGDHIDYCTGTDFEPLPSSPTKLHRKSVDSFEFSSASSQNSENSTSSSQQPRNKSINSSDDELPLSQLNTPKKKGTSAGSSNSRFRRSKEEVTWPRPGQNMWMSVDSQEQLDSLMKSLNQNGIRESKLHRALEKNYDAIIRSINKKSALLEKTAEPPTRRSTLPADGEELHKHMATKHLQTLIRDACRGGLAEVDEPDIFEQRIATLESVSQYSVALLEIFDAIPKKFLKRYMTGISDKKKKAASEQSEEELIPEREKVKAENRVIRWRTSVEEATLFSRFCLLLAILNNSIKWELYQYRRVNARRRVARNKNYADVEAKEPEEEEEEEEEEEDEEENEESSDEEEPQRRSSRIRAKKKAAQVEETTPPKRTRRRTYNYRIESSDEEEEEVDQDEEETDQDVVDDNSSGKESEESQGEESDEELDDESSTCRNIVEKLMKYQYSEIFRDPVDGDEVPDYYDIVTDPICLSDILDKIDNASGTQKQSNGDAAYTMAKLMADVRLLLDNAYLYNADDSFEVKQAKKLENSFVRLCRDSISDSVELRRLRNMFDTTR